MCASFSVRSTQFYIRADQFSICEVRFIFVRFVLYFCYSVFYLCDSFCICEIRFVFVRFALYLCDSFCICAIRFVFVRFVLYLCVAVVGHRKTAYARKSFMFMGAKVYNELPLELRKIENNKEFEKQLKEHFQ